MLQSITLAMLIAFAGPSVELTSFNVDKEKSTIKWTGAKVGGSHYGTIELQEGALEMGGDQLIGGSFIIDMTSISCDDLSGGSKGKLEGHLKSDDFFGVENNPTATFEITKAVPQGPGKYKVTGDLTIKGITKEIKFPATVEDKDGMTIATADITVDRSEFDVRYGSGSFFDGLGDKVIYDDFELSVSLAVSK